MAHGKPAQLAIIDEAGNILAAGPEVAREAEAVALNNYRNFLKGKGHLRVYKGIPPGTWKGGEA